MLLAVKGNVEVLNTVYDDWYEIHKELNGGRLQKALKTTGESLKDFSNDLWDYKIGNHGLKINTGFEKLDKALNKLAERISEDEFLEKILKIKVTPGINLSDEM
jgi:hypothetical protein